MTSSLRTEAPSRDDLRASFDALIRARGTPLVIAHRGTTLGSFPDNTLRSATGAVLSGADVVEIDVIASSDGEYFLFHTGYEKRHFGEDFDVRTLSSAELAAKRFVWQGGPEKPGVEKLVDLLHGLPHTWFNIDRSWGLWPGLLDELARLGVADRVLLKSPPKPEALAALAKHPVPFLYFPIVRTPEELEQVEAFEGLHLIGAELLASTPADAFADPATIAEVAARYPLILLNALNLENGARLYLDKSDETSLMVAPEAGWGRLVEAGATAIHTDWPHVVRQFLREQMLRT